MELSVGRVETLDEIDLGPGSLESLASIFYVMATGADATSVVSLSLLTDHTPTFQRIGVRAVCGVVDGTPELSPAIGTARALTGLVQRL
jgi:hypothetical protein